MLDHFGEFPNKYRLLTWKYLLQLPLNSKAFNALVQNGIHTAYRNLGQTYNGKKLFKLQKIMSALAVWCPLVAHLDFLIEFVAQLSDFI